MEERTIYTELNKIFSDIFDEDIRLTAETTANDIEDWDSLEHINIIRAVENRFGMKFKMGEISTMKNVGEMVGIIAERTTKG